MADTRQQQSKVVTEHEDANAAIDQLRHIAGVLKKVGDEALGLRGVDEERAEANAKLDEYERRVAEMEHEEQEFTRMLDAVADFDRGIIDRDELVNLAREMSHA